MSDGPKFKTESAEPSPRESALKAVEAEIARIKGDPETSFLFHSMKGLTQLRTIGTTSPLKQLMMAVGMLDNLLERGHSDLAPVMVQLGNILASALEDEANAAGTEAPVELGTEKRKPN